MDDFIICSGSKAENPYRMNYENRTIYRMEELCWYMSEHLFLVDEHLITKELFAWIGGELGQKQLERDLLECLKLRKSTAACAMLIFEESALYTEAELDAMEEKLAFYAELTDEERQKLLADHLLAVGLDRKALYLYIDLYDGVRGKRLSPMLLASVYFNAGRIYARQLCLQEAADLFAKSFKAGRGDDALYGWYAVLSLMSGQERQACPAENTDVPDPSDEQKQRVRARVSADSDAYFSAAGQKQTTDALRTQAKRSALQQAWIADYIQSVMFH